jgi:CheY-like chemotaxis protein
VISTDDARDRALGTGAYAFVAKPIQSKDVIDGLLDRMNQFQGRKRNVLVIEPDAARRKEMVNAIANEEVKVKAMDDGIAANRAISNNGWDLVVLGPKATRAIEPLSKREVTVDGVDSKLPVLVYADGGSGIDEHQGPWKRLAATCSVRSVRSPERLLDLAALDLHLGVAKLPAPARPEGARPARLRPAAQRPARADRGR